MCSKPFLSDSTNINDTDTYAVRSNSNFITYLLCNCRFCWYRQKKRKVYDGYRYKLLWNFQVISDVFIYLKGGGAWQKRQLVCLLIMVSRDAHLLIMMSKDAHLLIMVSKDAHLWLVFWSCPSVERTSFCPQLIYRIYISVFVPNWYTVYVYISPHICTLIVQDVRPAKFSKNNGQGLFHQSTVWIFKLIYNTVNSWYFCMILAHKNY